MLNSFCRSNYVLWAESNIGDLLLLLPSHPLPGWWLPVPACSWCRRNDNQCMGPCLHPDR